MNYAIPKELFLSLTLLVCCVKNREQRKTMFEPSYTALQYHTVDRKVPKYFAKPFMR